MSATYPVEVVNPFGPVQRSPRLLLPHRTFQTAPPSVSVLLQRGHSARRHVTS